MVNARYLFSRPILAVALVAGCCIWTGNALAVEAAIGNGGNHADEQLLQPRDTDRPLLDFAVTDAIKQLSAPVNFKVSRGHQSVEVTGSIKGKNQSLSITSTAKPWDLSGYLYLVADVRNDGTAAMTIVCRAEDPQYAGWHHYAESVARVKAGETRSVLVFLKRKDPPAEQLRSLFPGMDALPNGYMAHWSGLDPTHICKMVMGLESTGPEFKLQLLRLRGVGICDNAALTAPGYFPFIDAYGQFLHADWPTRIRTQDDFTTQRATEAAALHASPRPASWDQYGGYKNGPQLNASGNFRVEKYAGKWWFVDPDGRLFWSHGVTGVGFTIATPVKGRENFFTELPESTPGKPNSVNWYLANLKRKYGDNAETIVASLAHDRLSNWGLNTLASWSDERITSLDRTPYTKMLGVGGPRLAAGLKLADPFDDAFARNARNTFEAESNATGKDPWCIGYFIGNELEWRNGPDMINEVLTAPATQAGKRELVKMLQQRHPKIEDLNTIWHTSYASWDSLLESTSKVDATLALADFTAFDEALAQRYYETCQTEFKRAMPNKLNLGSRFNTGNAIAIRASARYCDVVSFNKYETSIANLKLPDGIDRPIIIGEFHFPAWDRSFTANADCGRLSEQQRADCYWYYLNSGIENPLVVGTHWFEYLDQPLTGRGDGENAPIGFVDVTDTPYEQLTQITREIGDNLYAHRLASK